MLVGFIEDDKEEKEMPEEVPTLQVDAQPDESDAGNAEESDGDADIGDADMNDEDGVDEDFKKAAMKVVDKFDIPAGWTKVRIMHGCIFGNGYSDDASNPGAHGIL